MHDRPNVCGSSPLSSIIQQSTCSECKSVIYVTKEHARWRHADGFVVCLKNFHERGDERNTVARPAQCN